MQIITIDSKAFFAKVRDNGISMWDMLELFIDGEEKIIHFLDDDKKLLLQYKLPTNKEQMKADQNEFATLLKKSLADHHKAQNN